MQKGGYSTAHVDAALERLEDAFAAEERQVAARLHGGEAWLSEARTTAQVVSNRLARPEGQRFDRVSPLALGYRVRDVDRFADKLTRYFRDGWPISIDDVRTVVFSDAARRLPRIAGRPRARRRRRRHARGPLSPVRLDSRRPPIHSTNRGQAYRNRDVDGIGAPGVANRYATAGRVKQAATVRLRLPRVRRASCS